MELVIGTMHQKQIIKDSIEVSITDEPPFLLLTAMTSALVTDTGGSRGGGRQENLWRGTRLLGCAD
jgi:hypothetical protein